MGDVFNLIPLITCPQVDILGIEPSKLMIYLYDILIPIHIDKLFDRQELFDSQEPIIQLYQLSTNLSDYNTKHVSYLY